jgi:hypothetical protein
MKSSMGGFFCFFFRLNFGSGSFGCTSNGSGFNNGAGILNLLGLGVNLDDPVLVSTD